MPLKLKVLAFRRFCIFCESVIGANPVWRQCLAWNRLVHSHQTVIKRYARDFSTLEHKSNLIYKWPTQFEDTENTNKVLGLGHQNSDGLGKSWQDPAKFLKFWRSTGMSPCEHPHTIWDEQSVVGLYTTSAATTSQTERLHSHTRTNTHKHIKTFPLSRQNALC